MGQATHWRRDVRESTRTVLASLGETSAQIAASLDRSGVRAMPRDPNDCAIAVFLNAVLAVHPDVRAVRVLGTEVMLCPERWWHPVVRVSLSTPLRHFVSSFDLGSFPQLIRTSEVDGRAASSIEVCVAGEGTSPPGRGEALYP
jgi:hypothetical protein